MSGTLSPAPHPGPAPHTAPETPTLPGYDPVPSSGLKSPVPHIAGGDIPIRRDGQDMNVTTGYQQSGQILSVKDGIVTLNAGKSIVEYRGSDLFGDAKGPEAMAKMLVPGRDIRVSIDSDHVNVTDLSRDRSQAQHQAQHPASPTIPGYDPVPSSGLRSPVPHIPGGDIPIRRDGQDMNVTTGYQQSGQILSVKDGIVTLNAGRSIVEYRASDLLGDAKGPEAATMLVPGRDIRVSIDSEHVNVTDLSRDRGLSQAQHHSR